jgi:hypothetical protein
MQAASAQHLVTLKKIVSALKGTDMQNILII